MTTGSASRSVRATRAVFACLIPTLLGGCALSLTGGAAPDPVLSGHGLTYQFVVSEDSGTSTVVDICVTDYLTSGPAIPVTATTSTGSGCVPNATLGAWVCDVGVMSANQTSTVTVTVGVTGTGVIKNKAVVAPCPCGQDLTCNGQSTDDPSDNTVSLSTTAVECLSDGDCDDSNPATHDQCSNSTCTHAECLSDADCDDSNPATHDQCSNGSCTHYECMSDADCDDGTNCTIRTCDTTNHVCQYIPVAAIGFCQGAQKSKLILTDDASDADDTVVFKILSANLSGFPDPTSTPIDICFADESFTKLRATRISPGGPWQTTGSGYKRIDPSGASEGITKVVIKPAKGKIIIKGKGPGLDDWTPGMLTPYVYAYIATAPLTCWGATYPAANITQNDGVHFKAKYP
jgi:hypothetical protein